MKTLDVQKLREDKGFTLVELAVVMIIIGLLIGGVLKGQELIRNAEVAALVSDVKGVDTGAATFRSTYVGIPGDLVNATTRLPASGLTYANGDGDGTVDQVYTAAAAGEGLQFWIQMAGANVYAGDGTSPETPLGGQFNVAWVPTNTSFNAAMGGGNSGAGSHWLTASANGITNPVVPGPQAERVDRKMDDGVANSGGVQAGPATCVYTGGGTGTCAMAYQLSN